MNEPIKCFFVEQPFGDQQCRRTDTGEIYPNLGAVPVGAMWFAEWFDDHFNPQMGSGKNLVVKTPGGDWMVDRQASNCTIPEDTNQERHHCWIIHGEVPEITVDKNGVTCGAGSGSIAQKTWHGFLRNGYLEEC